MALPGRRQFLRFAGALGARAMLPAPSHLGLSQTQPSWRTFEVTTRVDVQRPVGMTRVWLPAALITDTPYQRTLSNEATAPGGKVTIGRQESDALAVVMAEFPEGVTPVVTLVSRVATRAHIVDLSRPSGAARRSAATLAHFLRPTKLIPTDGIVRARAAEITRGATHDLDKARAIYEWIVDNTFRDPKVAGCGLGDIRFMLESGNLGGKCADLNALFVGLTRASGLPSRDVYGLRVVPSGSGFKSLGVSSDDVTRSQHCRAEVHVSGYGWIPVDPADVRKVALEEPPGNHALSDPLVRQARTQLFGAWEMNWIAYNFAHDVVLPASAGAPLPFLMYPQAESANGRLDSLAPDQFRYRITAREVVNLG